MDTKTIITNLQEIFADTFDVGSAMITRETSAKDVKGWDSIAHVMLITSIEKQFAICFTGREIAGFTTVGDLIDAIEKKTNEKK
jgi:acyl carrier protein